MRLPRPLALLVLALPPPTAALDNGVGITVRPQTLRPRAPAHAPPLTASTRRQPPMGFNTYQSPYAAGLDNEWYAPIAEQLTQTGLQALGFRYVNSDAGWQPNKHGRNASGSPVAQPGADMATVAAALRAKGFSLGLYSSLSSVQCGMAPGGLYHEDLDAASYAEWNLSYLKYDNCAEYALEPNARSAPMRDALNRTNHAILFSTEPFDLTPNPQAHIANLWRTTTDVSDDVAKVRINIDLNDKWAEFAGPGGFNDPDMLQCGKGKSTLNQHRTNYILWAIAKAPLLLSTNLTALAKSFPTLLQLLTTKGVAEINQDAAGIQARKLTVDGAPVGKPVGVETCAAPDLVAVAAAGGDFGSMAEVAAAKQRWEAVPVLDGTAGVVQLRNVFYSGKPGEGQQGRCLALQPPNKIAYSPPFRHPSRPNPRPVWSADWQAVLLPCNASHPLQRWRFLAPGQFPSETATGFAKRTLSALVNEGANITPPPDGGSANPFNSSNSSEIVLSLLPETDSRYGVNHIGGAALEYPDAEVACTTRGCDQYQPSQVRPP